jgi:hypothetical protein
MPNPEIIMPLDNMFRISSRKGRVYVDLLMDMESFFLESKEEVEDLVSKLRKAAKVFDSKKNTASYPLRLLSD